MPTACHPAWRSPGSSHASCAPSRPAPLQVRWRLFREACYPYEGSYVKDLQCLGRDLGQTIIVDNSPHSYVFQVGGWVDGWVVVCVLEWVCVGGIIAGRSPHRYVCQPRVRVWGRLAVWECPPRLRLPPYAACDLLCLQPTPSLVCPCLACPHTCAAGERTAHWDVHRRHAGSGALVVWRSWLFGSLWGPP